MKCRICNVDLVWGKNHGGGEDNTCDKCKQEIDTSVIRAAAAFMGKLGGLSRSQAKQAASRANGAKGGRPKSK